MIKNCCECKQEYDSEVGHKCNNNTIASDGEWAKVRALCEIPGFSRKDNKIIHCGQPARIERGGMSGVHAHCILCGAWDYILNIRSDCPEWQEDK